MDQKVLDFLNKERVCSLTVLLKDGSPHSVSMHYSFDDNPFELYFSTDKTSRKGEDIFNSPKAAFLIGFSEQDWETFQVEGKIEVIEDVEIISKIKVIHYQRNPSSQKFEGNPNTIFMKLIPSWWKYTDYKTKPLTVVSSE